MNFRLSTIRRILNLDLADHNAALLWGARKVGKTTLLCQRFPRAARYDLSDTALRTRLLLRPSLLREELLACLPQLVVIEEIQEGDRV